LKQTEHVNTILDNEIRDGRWNKGWRTEEECCDDYEQLEVTSSIRCSVPENVDRVSGGGGWTIKLPAYDVCTNFY
jgi:hypothetical protein